MERIKNLLNDFAGLMLLEAVCVAAIVVASFVIAFTLLWVAPIVLAWLYGWWWLGAEILVVVLYYWVWKQRVLKESMGYGDDGEYE